MESEWSEEVQAKLALLGDPIEEFALHRRRLIRNLILAPLLILGGLALDALLIVEGHGGLAKFIVFGAFMVIAGITLMVRAIRNLGLRVLVFPEGIVQIRRDEAQTIFWDEVLQVVKRKNDFGWVRAWQGALNFTLNCPGGKSMYLDDSLPRLKQLGEIIYQETLPYLLPKAQTEYEAGKKLVFGKLQLKRRGITSESGALEWREVESFKFEGESIIIKKKGKWTSWFQGSASDIPNVHVLQALVEQYLPKSTTTNENETT